MKQNFTLLVNSTDSYSDCWEPFFKLMTAYWPEYKGPVYLNTETKEFSYPGLNIICSHSADASPGRRPTWTECITHTLNQIETDTVLYVQEDYFFKSAVQHEALCDLANLFEREKMTYMSIVDFGQRGPYQPTDIDKRLWKVDQKDRYRISLQACLISKSRFMRYFRKHENPWQFEFYGNKRAHRTPDKFYTLNRDKYKLAENPIFPYDPTGIVTKRWKQDVVEDLFMKHNIEVDYSIRGWHAPDPNAKAVKKRWTLEKIVSTIKSLI